LEQHRHNLRDGEACPLCGAEEHPYATQLPPKNDKLQEEILAAQLELEQLERQNSSLETSLAHHQKRLAQLQKDLREKQLELEAQKGDFQEQFSGLNPSGENWEEFCSSREEKLQLLDNFGLEKRKLKAIAGGIEIIPQIKEVLTQGKQIKAELDELYTGNDIDTDCLDLQKIMDGTATSKAKPYKTGGGSQF
jgi:DNA repair protein SbcC/Rad50